MYIKEKTENWLNYAYTDSNGVKSKISQGSPLDPTKDFEKSLIEAGKAAADKEEGGTYTIMIEATVYVPPKEKKKVAQLPV